MVTIIAKQKFWKEILQIKSKREELVVPLCVMKRKIVRYGIELEINNINTNNNNNNKRLDMRFSNILT